MTIKYDLTYHLAPGVAVKIDGVSEGHFLRLEKGLENSDGVVNVSSKKTNIIQLIPVRNILAVEAIKHEA